jgi:hypothetical protein
MAPEEVKGTGGAPLIWPLTAELDEQSLLASQDCLTLIWEIGPELLLYLFSWK